MKFKNTKKVPPKKETPKENKNTLKKEEIKEIIEETVEEVLKEQSTDKASLTITPSEEKSTDSVEEEKTADVENVVVPTIAPEEEKPAEGSEPEEEKVEGVEPQAVAPVTAEGQEKSAGPEVTLSSSPFGDGETATTSPVVSEQSGSFVNEQEQPSKKSPVLGILIAFFAFGLVVGGGFWYLSSHNMLSTTKLQGLLPLAKPTPTTAPTPTSAPTPKQVDVSMYKVAVLNGSGVAGEAAKVKTLLTDAGFTVSNTGNATSSDFVQTVISVKASVSQDAINKLINDLSKDYTVSQHPVTLNNSESTDIVVTVGSPK